MNSLFRHLAFAFIFFTSCVGLVHAQRDFVTPEEVELIREYQQIDQRIGVLVHAADRRFAVLKLDVGAPKRPGKSEAWGEMPAGTRLELLADIKRILQKAIDDIDTLAERPSSLINDPYAKKPKSYEELFPKAVRDLAAAARRFAPVLKSELDRETGKAERGVLMDSLTMCEEIIAAAARLPAENKKKN